MSYITSPISTRTIWQSYLLTYFGHGEPPGKRNTVSRLPTTDVDSVWFIDKTMLITEAMCKKWSLRHACDIQKVYKRRCILIFWTFTSIFWNSRVLCIHKTQRQIAQFAGNSSSVCNFLLITLQLQVIFDLQHTILCSMTKSQLIYTSTVEPAHPRL